MKQVFMVTGDTGDAVTFIHRHEADVIARAFDLTVTPVPLFGTAPMWFEDEEGETDDGEPEG